jgi:hypothetical protein
VGAGGEDVSGNRLFSLSHRDVYLLFRSWGWVDGVERGDGHKRMVWPPTGQVVQIMPPDRAGTGELGNAKAMKQAWKIMGLSSLDEFFVGLNQRIVEERAERKQRDVHLRERLQKEAERRIHQRAAVAAQSQEEHAMTNRAGRPHRDGSPPFSGIVDAITTILKDAGVALNIQEVTERLRPQFPGVDEKAVGTNLHNATRSKHQKVQRVGYGTYQYVGGVDPVDVVIEAPAPPETQPSTPVTPPPVEPPPAPPQPASLNGSSPELLQRAFVLDGGRYLYQGDDGRLYIVSGLVPLNV